ncbi:MAG: TetR family transcriptional regulator [Ilumatobacteraceae bacterium]|nr:TetR family transcriptional regulator [Ilumatobacteraceae bacterium]
MSKANEFELHAHEIVDAAVEIFQEAGLDAVSMRSVSTRLGVSPVPLYSRIGNRDALVDAIADRLLEDLAPPSNDDERWDEYALRWSRELRARLAQARDSRLIIWHGREAYVEASRPLAKLMRRDGFAVDAAVQACRLLIWATVGFGAVEGGAEPPSSRRGRARPGGDPGGVDATETDTLFDLHIRYLIEGIARDASPTTAPAPAPAKAAAKRKAPRS